MTTFTLSPSRIAIVLWLALLLPAGTHAQHSYRVSMNLSRVTDDKVEVSIRTPSLSDSTVEYRLPKIVPGTYSVYDFGRFISDFKATDSLGHELRTDSLSPNRIQIHEAYRLAAVSYRVEDTYDTQQPNFVFEPAGTNIEQGKNFIINPYGFVGYIEGYQHLNYTLHIDHPRALYGATSLQATRPSDTLDIFSAHNYQHLADSPIMYCPPDTTRFQLAGADILVSVYSPSGVVKSDLMAGYVQETLEAQVAYLGGKLPVDHYTFLFYHFSGIFSGSLAMGALEHAYSSLYSLPDIHPILISQTLKDFVAHEFFHIVTPLNIHAEQIANFDFSSPAMSKHLWLYEGVTEYAAGLAQVKYGQLSFRLYLEMILEKIKNAGKYNDTLPFTELSLHCLDKHASQYGNVYQKGALIGLCLDIRLRQLSNGKYGIQELMTDLSARYGKDKPFKDDELFDSITEITYPEIRAFFTQYVEGPSPLPLGELLSQVGIRLTREQSGEKPTMGNISFQADHASRTVVITDISQMNAFGREMGYQEGDVLHAFDGKKVTANNFHSVLETFTSEKKAGQKTTAVVWRESKNGKRRKIKLTATSLTLPYYTDYQLTESEVPSPAQLRLRKAWVNK